MERASVLTQRIRDFQEGKSSNHCSQVLATTVNCNADSDFDADAVQGTTSFRQWIGS